MMSVPDFIRHANPRNWPKKSAVPERTSALQALVEAPQLPDKTYPTDIPTPAEMAQQFVVRSANVYHTIQCLVMWLEMDAKSGKRNLRDTFCYEAVHYLNDNENTEVKNQFQQRGWLIQSEYLLAKARFKYTIQFPRQCYTEPPLPQ